MIRTVLTFWSFLLTLALIGWGILGVKLLQPEKQDTPPALRFQAPQLLLIGLFFVTAQALLANFIVPLTIYGGLYVIGVGFSLLVAFRRNIDFTSKEILSLTAATLWVVWGLPFEGLSGDAALYHMQFEQWISHSRVLFGLANLQTRFGFDSTWLIFVSAVRIDFSPTLSPWLHAIAADMMIRAFVFWWLLLRLTESQESKERFGTVFYGVCFSVLSILLWRMRQVGTDNPSNLIAIGLWLVSYEAWTNRGDKYASQNMIAALLAASLILTSKLSILPLVIFVLPILVAYRHDWRRLIRPGVVFSVFFALWLCRNYILSGCLVYPAAATCLDVPWGLGSNRAASEAWVVTTFARIHVGPSIMLDRTMESVTNFSIDWFREWIYAFPTTYYFRTMLAAGLIGVVFFMARGRRPADHRRSIFLLSSMAVALLGFVYWLILGPDPRFSWAVFFILSITFATLGCAANVERKPTRETSSNYLALPIIVCICTASSALTRVDSLDTYLYTDLVTPPFHYRGVDFVLAQEGLCGDHLPCVVSTSDLTGLDRVIDTNQGVLERQFGER